jgi:acetyltransferase-like isoleucine patch superfamily enzyme
MRNVLGEMRIRQQQLTAVQSRFPGRKFAQGIELVGYADGRLEAGCGVTICHGTVLAFGDEENGFGRIRVGTSTWIGQYNNLRACADGDIVVGQDCLISQFCTLVGSNHGISRSSVIQHQGPDRSRLGVVLGDDIWLGAGVVVVPGVSIGNGAVIGANSVVVHPIPEYEIWAGVPARKIGERH